MSNTRDKYTVDAAEKAISSNAITGALIGTFLLPGFGTILGLGIGGVVGALKLPEIFRDSK